MEIVKEGDYVMYRRQDNSIEVYRCVKSNGTTDSLSIQRKEGGKNQVFDTTFRARTKNDAKVRVCRLWIQPYDTGFIDGEPCTVDRIEGAGGTMPVVCFSLNNSPNRMYLNIFAEKFTFEQILSYV